MARARGFRQRSVMPPQQRFSQVPSVNIQRSVFDRSHGLKTTLDAGYLVPIYVDEVLPGDTFRLSATAFGRLATPLHPIMDNLFLDMFFFFVPNRLVWDNWEQFISGQEDLTVPRAVTDDPVLHGTLPDYMGIPPIDPGSNEVSVNALPFRAYNLIWNEWFRDQNLQEELEVPTDDGGEDLADYTLMRRGKRHDYFTACLPWPQKGDPVEIPIGGLAPVIGLDQAPTGYTVANTTPLNIRVAPAGNGGLNLANYGSAVSDFRWGDPALVTDLSEATAITINQLREAFQIQRMLERDARGGSRYVELLLSHFGVVSPDARLQRPEYLGGGSQRMRTDPIAATVQTPDAPQGNLAAVGTAVGRGGFSKSFVEHGYIIGMVNIRADLTYQQGLERHWSRQTRYDYYWPALAHLGEQGVLMKEIFYRGEDAVDTEVFGYQERFAEYRYKPSQVTGLFRSSAPQSLDVWHLSQDFEDPPRLNAEFIEDDPPIDRVIATPEEPHLILDVYFRARTARPMPVYGQPGFIDRF